MSSFLHILEPHNFMKIFLSNLPLFSYSHLYVMAFVCQNMIKALQPLSMTENDGVPNPNARPQESVGSVRAVLSILQHAL